MDTEQAWFITRCNRAICDLMSLNIPNDDKIIALHYYLSGASAEKVSPSINQSTAAELSEEMLDIGTNEMIEHCEELQKHMEAPHILNEAAEVLATKIRSGKNEHTAA